MLCPPHEAGRGDGGALLAVRSAQRPAPAAVTAGSGHGSQSGGRWREAPSVNDLPSAAGHPVRPLGTEGRRQKKEPGTRRSGGPGGRTTTLQAAGDAPAAPGACASARGSGAPVSLTTRRATGDSARPLAPSARNVIKRPVCRLTDWRRRAPRPPLRQTRAALPRPCPPRPQRPFLGMRPHPSGSLVSFSQAGIETARAISRSAAGGTNRPM